MIPLMLASAGLRAQKFPGSGQMTVQIMQPKTAVLSQNSAAADTLRLSLEQTDSLFLQHNFELLARRYQVRADSALIRQAKLWDNPSFTAELGMNSLNKLRPSMGSTGETAYTIDQIIQLVGKRSKSVALATLNMNYSEASFQDLMRTLKWQLHHYFTQYYFKCQTVQVLKEQQSILGTIVTAYQQADASGSVAHADYMRLRQLQISLKNDFLSAISELSDLQQSLQQLMGVSNPILPVYNAAAVSNLPRQLSLSDLIHRAIKDRPDMQMSLLDNQSSLANYQLQKAMAVPDLHVGATYDKNSGVVHNYVGLTLGIDLPIWNRNQGNIRSARLLVDQAGLKKDQTENIVTTEVTGAYQKYQDYKEAFQPGELSGFQQKFNSLISQVAANFTKGNITLLQFIDFFNSYTDNFNDQNGYYSALLAAYNDLEYAVGTSLNGYYTQEAK